MKAIIIEDKDARALIERLELAKLRERTHSSSHAGEPPSWDDMHRTFHYVVTSWLQEQGCDTVRR